MWNFGISCGSTGRDGGRRGPFAVTVPEVVEPTWFLQWDCGAGGCPREGGTHWSQVGQERSGQGFGTAVTVTAQWPQ